LNFSFSSNSNIGGATSTSLFIKKLIKLLFIFLLKYYIIVLNIMFFCKNDKTRSYKGSEPSPKGFGICAHAEKMNTIQTGTDGNMWKIQKTSNNIKRWVTLKLIFLDSFIYKTIKKRYNYILYLRIPFILATNTFIICNTTCTNSSSGRISFFLLIIIISPLE
jgi:hypothetical protein